MQQHCCNYLLYHSFIMTVLTSEPCSLLLPNQNIQKIGEICKRACVCSMMSLFMFHHYITVWSQVTGRPFISSTFLIVPHVTKYGSHQVVRYETGGRRRPNKDEGLGKSWCWCWKVCWLNKLLMCITQKQQCIFSYRITNNLTY